jgi:hypothetical protein
LLVERFGAEAADVTPARLSYQLASSAARHCYPRWTTGTGTR